MTDPWSNNRFGRDNRPHVTKSQRTMAVAKIFPEPEKRGRGNNSVLRTEFSGGSATAPPEPEEPTVDVFFID